MIDLLWLLVIGIISFFICIVLIYQEEIVHKSLTILESIAIIICFICIGLALYSECAAKPVYEDTPYAIEKVVALQDNNLENGRFYFRHGYYNEAMWYQYMVKLNDGSMTMNKIKAEGTKVYYSDEPKVKWYHGEKVWWIFKVGSCQKQELYVPEGAIINDYSIDLQ